MFELDSVLKKDTIHIKDLKLCTLLLMDNALYPWLILVPKKANLVEIIDLEPEDRILLMTEISFISNIVKKEFNADKLNIAALGNVVKQLHVHIIARYQNDEWELAGHLNVGRYGHSSITFEGLTMIIGGYTAK